MVAKTSYGRCDIDRGLFHSQGASDLFRTASQLDAEGAYPVAGNRWKQGEEIFVPLYEGKMVQAFDHRAASIATRKSNLFRPGQPVRTSAVDYRDPGFSPRPRFWINKSEHAATQELQYFLGFKEITASTNVRTMIASVVPQVGCTDTLAVLLPNDEKLEALDVALILANLNSFSFDFVARQKIPATHIKLYMLEQLPFIAPNAYDRRFGDHTAADLVHHHVLRLTYTAHDMAPFARDLGHHAPPFLWDEEERRHLRARLDALYFHLYGLDPRRRRSTSSPPSPSSNATTKPNSPTTAPKPSSSPT